ncbi:MAG: hypothetical protein LBE22_10390 [Azoarcus sp.]|nr:hypothetical protein [Azoarcus sp.]
MRCIAQDIRNRWHRLLSERSSYELGWRQSSKLVFPRSGRFLASDRNRGGDRSNEILDNTVTRAVRTLAAAMVAGMSSPASKWMRLTTSSPELDESHAVKTWLSKVETAQFMIFAKSNTYRALHSLYEEQIVYGQASDIIDDNYRTVIHNHTLTVGEYAFACDSLGQVDTLYREFDMTVSQLVETFGINNVSGYVRRRYESREYDYWVTVLHAIEPRRGRDTRKRDNLNMRWRSVYIERDGDKCVVLRESGYEDFPALCPRWIVRPPDVYGDSPVMDALGDIKQLQHEQLRKSKGIDWQTDPAIIYPANFKDSLLDTRPGSAVFGNAAAQTAAQPVFDARYMNLSYLLQDIEDVRKRIHDALYTNVILMIAEGGDQQKTAREISAREVEKLMVLGPVLERQQAEILEPLVNLTFMKALRAGILPPPPPEIQGQELSVEYISMLAQSQRAFGLAATDRFVSKLGMISEIKPEVLDRFDADRWVDVVSDAEGVDPSIIVAGPQAAIIRQQRAEQEQAAKQAMAMQQGADIAAKLSSADMSGDNALTQMAGM